MNKNFKLLVIVLAALFILVGCTPKDSTPSPSPTASPAPSPTEQVDENGNDKPAQEVDTAEGVKDGQYTGRSDTDERGGYGVVTLTVADGKITEVKFEEYTSDDKVKSKENGYEYEQALEAFDELAKELVDEQDVSEVDDYSGATSTSGKFKQAAKRALGQGLDK